jgi:hypothetical protein
LIAALALPRGTMTERELTAAKAVGLCLGAAAIIVPFVFIVSCS